MSIRLLQKVMFALLTLLSAASCSTEIPEFVVDGVPGKFCVPQEHLAPGVWWLPPDAPGTPQGFSFHNCTTAEPPEAGTCELPGPLVSADVAPILPGWAPSWEHLKHSGSFHALSSDPAARFEIDGATGFLVVSNPESWRKWFIWRRADTQAGGEVRLMDQDMLVASCTPVADFPYSTGSGFDGVYGCVRYAVGPDFAVDYRFISPTRVPEQVEALDAAIIDRIWRWQCKAR